MERLLERQAVMAELGGLARGVRRGAGRVVLLRGEAGVGKTAVITRFSAGLDGTLRVLRGWCDPLGAPRPLGPLLDALADLGGAAAGGLGAAIDAADTAGIYRRLLAVLRDGQRWVWVIEDAHWADGATLDLVRFLARRIARCRCCWWCRIAMMSSTRSIRCQWRWGMWPAVRRLAASGWSRLAARRWRCWPLAAASTLTCCTS